MAADKAIRTFHFIYNQNMLLLSIMCLVGYIPPLLGGINLPFRYLSMIQPVNICEYQFPMDANREFFL